MLTPVRATPRDVHNKEDKVTCLSELQIKCGQDVDLRPSAGASWPSTSLDIRFSRRSISLSARNIPGWRVIGALRLGGTVYIK